MIRTLALVDGEHHPPVVRAALSAAEAAGHSIVGAVFLGGGEKVTGTPDYGVPLVKASAASWEGQRAALEDALAQFQPAQVLDLCDAPVVDETRRLGLAAIALARGAGYRGAGFFFEPPLRPRLCEAPSVAVIGSAKRAGKTAIGAHLARAGARRGLFPVVVAMGRGGPAEPKVVRGDRARPTSDELLEVLREGGHAASDFYEDAVMAGVATVGARRAGAGMTGQPFDDTVAAAVEAANELTPGLIVLEGSGTAVPPVAADACVLVTRSGDNPGAGVGSYRLLLADLVVVTMCEEPIVSSHDLSALVTSLKQLARGVRIVRTVFRPTPVQPISGRTVFYATTAPESVSEKLVEHLEGIHGAKVVGISHRLSDRSALASDMAAAAGRYEVLVTELKAAAIDVATRAAAEGGAEIVFAGNQPVALDDDLDDALEFVMTLATSRFQGRPAGSR